MEAGLEPLRRKEKQLRSDIEAQTAKLIDDRNEQLAAVANGWQDRVEGLQGKTKVLKDMVRARTLDLERVTSKITGAIAELEQHQETLSLLQDQLRRGQVDIDLQTAKFKGLEAQIIDVSVRIAPLHAEKLELDEAVETLKRRKAQYLETEEKLEAQYNENLATRELTLHNLESRAQEVALKVERDEKTWAQVRENLAVREAKLNEREQVVINRELKVNRDERNLAHNVDILNL